MKNVWVVFSVLFVLLLAYPVQGSASIPSASAFKEELLGQKEAGKALGVTDAWLRHLHSLFTQGYYVDANRLYEGFPLAEDWPELEEKLLALVESKKYGEARSNALQLLVLALREDEEAQKKFIESLLPTRTRKKAPSSLFVSLMKSFDNNDHLDDDFANSAFDYLFDHYENIEEWWSVYERCVAYMEGMDADSRSYFQNSLQVPPLEVCLSEPQLSEVLQSLVFGPVESLRFKSAKTESLATSLALEHANRFTKANWTLAQKNMDLFMYFVEKFPVEQKERTDYAYRNAAQNYLRFLLEEDRVKDAMDFFEQNPGINIGYYGLSAKARDGLYELLFKRLQVSTELKEMLDASVWKNLLLVASDLDKLDQLTSLLTGLDEEEWDADTLLAFEQRKVALLLAKGEREEAVQHLQKRLSGDAADEDTLRTLLSVARAGKDVELIEWVYQLYVDSTLAFGEEKMIDVLLENRLHEPALSMIRSAMAKAMEDSSKLKQNRYNSFSREARRLSDCLLDLCQLYFQVEDYESVVEVVESYPWWGKPALQLDEVRGGFLHVYAKSLWQLGRVEESVLLAREGIRHNLGSDDLYALLLEADKDVLVFLDGLIEKYIFEERPLIWKAQYLLDRGEVATAEKLIRQAIAIDPSDGEMGKGDRMRAYAVLLDILKVQGKDKDVAFFSNVIEAIRLSEDADDYFSAGLTAPAIAMYYDALALFADAYCIQSRLALQLKEAGRMDEAVEHYRKAYKLMPDSFGRMESHCFGCEGAFDGEVPQSVAEEVFGEMLQQPDAKAQVYYLMGYLKDSQGKLAEARELFGQAVEKDPLYYNAVERWYRAAQATLCDRAQVQRIEDKLNSFNQYFNKNRFRSNLNTFAQVDEALQSEKENAGLPEIVIDLPASRRFLEDKFGASAVIESKSRSHHISYRNLPVNRLIVALLRR